MIELKNISKDFGSGEKAVHAVRDVSLSIGSGEIFGIIGFSGAGKSTLVRCINLLERPSSGSVFVAGQDLTALSAKDLRAARKKIGMIFQHFNLMPSRTVAGNVAYPLKGSGLSKEDIQKKVATLLELVGIGDKADAYPSQLSGGQKQRVAIARALANDPQVLLCDEATSALDPTTTGQILELLAKINRELGVTIIVITHEMKVIDAICHRVAVIDRSHIAEEGPVSEVFVNPQSAIAQELILQKDRRAPEVFSGQRIRIVFDDKTANKPVISDLILACQAPVNIIFADTREVGGIVYGHMIVQLPQDERQRDKITAWLHANNITFKEEV